MTASAGGTPTGTVTFMIGGTTAVGTATLSGGQAAFTTSSLPPGSSGMTAVYSGDDQFASSTSTTLKQVVNKGTTTATLSSAPNPSTVGQPVTFTVSVACSIGIAPTGTVSFMQGGTTLGVATLNTSGDGSFTTSTLSSRNNNVRAVYNGDANCSGSTSNTVQQVVQ